MASKRKQQKREYPAPAPSVSETGRSMVDIDVRRLIRTVLIVCVLAELFFVWADYTINASYWTDSSPIRRLFNITREDSMSSWFGITVTWMVAITMWLIFMMSGRQGASKATRWGWGILAGAFTYMTVDDGSKIHERMGSAFGDAQEARLAESVPLEWNEGITHIFPSYNWQILFVPLFAVLGVFMLIFLFRKLRTVKARIGLLVVLGMLTGAVGLDFIEGLDEDHEWNAYTHIVNAWDIKEYSVTTFRRPPYDAVRHFSKSVEEFTEMLAMTILWVILLRHLAEVSAGGGFRLVGAKRKE